MAKCWCGLEKHHGTREDLSGEEILKMAERIVRRSGKFLNYREDLVQSVACAMWGAIGSFDSGSGGYLPHFLYTVGRRAMYKAMGKLFTIYTPAHVRMGSMVVASTDHDNDEGRKFAQQSPATQEIEVDANRFLEHVSGEFACVALGWTQAELGRQRGVSREAVRKSVNKEARELRGLSAAAKAERKPLPPEELFDAKSERVHKDLGRARAARVARENKLRAMGFDDPTPEDRRKNLALNVALKDWPR